MDINLPKQHNDHLKDRIMRFKPIAFIKKNIAIFVLIFAFGLSILLGLWNIKKYTVTDINGETIPDNVLSQIDEYLDTNLIGKNYFSFSTITYENEMPENLSYIKDARIEKVMPNKLEIFVNIYVPNNIAFIRGESCYVLSEEGYVLNNICKDDVENCCKKYAEDEKLYLFSSDDVDVSSSNEGKQKLYIMDSILKIVKVVRTYKYNVKEVSLNDTLIVVTLDTDQVFKFSTNEDIDTQLSKFIVVANKVKSDSLKFESIDFRFERPVLKK